MPSQLHSPTVLDTTISEQKVVGIYVAAGIVIGFDSVHRSVVDDVVADRLSRAFDVNAMRAIVAAGRASRVRADVMHHIGINQVISRYVGESRESSNSRPSIGYGDRCADIVDVVL